MRRGTTLFLFVFIIFHIFLGLHHETQWILSTRISWFLEFLVFFRYPRQGLYGHGSKPNGDQRFIVHFSELAKAGIFGHPVFFTFCCPHVRHVLTRTKSNNFFSVSGLPHQARVFLLIRRK